MNILLKMGEVEPLQLVIVLKTPIMASKEVAMRMKGHTMWLTILKTYPITKATNTVTYKMTLIVASMIKICEIKLMSVVLHAHIIQKMNPTIFVKGL